MSDAPEKNGSSELSAIKKKVIRQVEFYFGDYNLMRDTFMKETMQENEGWFTMDTMLKFKRLASICSEPSTILEALEGADMSLLEIDAEKKRIRRKPNREIPVDNEDYRAKLKARTVHVKGFQSEESIDDMHDFISDFGKLEGIHLLRTPDKKFKGSLYATFFKLEDAQKFVQAPMVYYKCNELTKMMKTDFIEEEKKRSKKAKGKEKQNEENSALKGIVALKVSGITDDTIIHVDIKQVVESKDVKNIRFFDRTEPMGSEGYLIMEDSRSPEELLKVLEDNGGTKVTIKSAEVEFSKFSDEEKEKIDELYIKARERFFSGGRDKRKQHRHQNQRPGRQNKKRGNFDRKGKKTTFGSDDEGEKKQETTAEDKEEPVAKVAKTE